MKLFRRITASLLLFVMLFSCPLPVSAVRSSFDDITDETTAINADILRFMGIISGKGNNRFDPDGQLTRAEFCTMVIGILGKTSLVSAHLNELIFTDVNASHWGRGYINLAAVTPAGPDKTGGYLISGFSDGTFHPDEPITYGQACTVLVRILGYVDADVGNIWPGDYVAKAEQLGLSAGIASNDAALPEITLTDAPAENATADNFNADNDTAEPISAAAPALDPFGPITRAQAVQLLINLLTSQTRDGNVHCSTLGSVTPDAVLTSVNVTDATGTPGAVMTSYGRYMPAGTTLPAALVGCRGTQIISPDNLLVAFLPDRSNVTFTVMTGLSHFLTTTDGTVYRVHDNLPVYLEGKEESVPYSKARDLFSKDVQVTAHLSGDSVTSLFVSNTSTTPGKAVVVRGTPSADLFAELTDGSTNYTILKAGQPISMEDIRLYDVVTYSKVQNALLVSDLRVTALYESAFPSVTEPENISILGIEGGIEVLPSAQENLSRFRLGNIFTVLLTADGKVAGAITPTSSARPTAVGLLSGSAVEIPLPAGGFLVCNGAIDFTLDGQVVNVSSTYRGQLNVSRLPYNVTPDDFDVKEQMLGSYPVAAGCAFYAYTPDSSRAIFLSADQLPQDLVRASRIIHYALNGSGMVTLMILKLDSSVS